MVKDEDNCIQEIKAVNLKQQYESINSSNLVMKPVDVNQDKSLYSVINQD